MKTKRLANKDCILGGSGGSPNLSWPCVYVLQHYRSGSLSKGISAEIEDAKITAEETKISILKRGSEN